MEEAADTGSKNNLRHKIKYLYFTRIISLTACRAIHFSQRAYLRYSSTLCTLITDDETAAL